MWSVLVFLTLLKYTVGTVIGNTKMNLHRLMTKREIEVYFGVNNHSEIPEYRVITPRATESNGRVLPHFRRRRHMLHPDVLHYKLHAFGSKLQLRLKRNLMLMVPNLVIETHHGGGVVTTQPAPKNKFFLGKVSSDPDSLVAMRSDRALMGMIRTSGDTFFVQPLPSHLAKRVRRRADTIPHLIYRGPPLKRGASGYQAEKSVKRRIKRSTHLRKPRATNGSSGTFNYMEAALIVPQHFVDKYGQDKYTTVLLVIANIVASMYQDPSIGKYKIYYVVTKIFHIKSVANELKFSPGDQDSRKMTKVANWASKYIAKPDSDPSHFDVFSYITGKMVGGRALIGQMCKVKSGNMNSDVGLQTALYMAHEIGHNLNLGHDGSGQCPGGTYIMSPSLPGGVLAATWSNCSRRSLEAFLGNNKRAKCLRDPPPSSSNSGVGVGVSSSDQNKLPGEIFDGNYQCQMQYGPSFILSPYRPGVCGRLYCFVNGSELSRGAPLSDGTPCGIRNWCIGGRCQDNGKKRIPGEWSSWSLSYSHCTYSCGGGVQYRTRQCDNPPPMNGGEPCKGSAREWRICNSAPCAAGVRTYRQQQCAERQPGSSPYTGAPGCGSLFCLSSGVVRSKGRVNDGTRCSFDKTRFDVCIQGHCRNVGCDHKLDSYAMIDRWGVCGGNGDSYFVIDSNYSTQYNVKGPENADLITELVVGTVDAFFQFKSATVNDLGVQAANGTYLVGGHLSGKTQTKQAAGTTIVYAGNKRKKSRDVLRIAGPTNAVLRVMYIYRQGANPGLGYRYGRPPQVGDPPSSYEWKTEAWSGCSATCGHGVRTRRVRCIRSDDKTPASNSACNGTSKPAAQERCPGNNCSSRWITTPWSDCSTTCGNGQQTRRVECVMDLTSTEYVPSSNCSNATKPVVTNILQSCNSFDCYPDWDTEKGLDGDKCGDPIDPALFYCYRRDQFGKKSLVPSLLCQNKPKPNRVPCPTTSTSSSVSTPPPPSSLILLPSTTTSGPSSVSSPPSPSTFMLLPSYTISAPSVTSPSSPSTSKLVASVTISSPSSPSSLKLLPSTTVTAPSTASSLSSPSRLSSPSTLKMLPASTTITAPSSPSTTSRPTMQSTTTAPTGKPPDKFKMSAGMIAGIVVGMLIIAAVLIAGVYYFCWGRNRKPFCYPRKTRDRSSFSKIDIPLEPQLSQVSC